MAHLVMDQIFAHEIDLSISDEMIAERQPEWNKATTSATTKFEYVRNILAFVGLDLIEYDTAHVRRSLERSAFEVSLRSAAWASRRRA